MSHHDHHGHEATVANAAAPPPTVAMAHDAALMDDPVHHHLAESAGESHMMMSMFFHGGYDEVILFDIWRINSAGGLIGSMIICFLMGILYEGLKFLSGYLSQRMTINRGGNRGPKGLSSKEDAANATQETAVQGQRRWTSVLLAPLNSVHLVQTSFHFLQLGLAYLLMLIVMTYNTWLFFSVILGCTAGYFVFGCRKFAVSPDASDHCQ